MKILILISLMLTSFGVWSQETCLSEDKDLAQLDIDFQECLKKEFNLDRALEGKDYKRYIKGIISQSIPRKFFTGNRKVKKAKLLQKSERFKLIWNRASEIEKETNKKFDKIEISPPITASDRGEEQRRDYYTLDTNSEVFNCLIENTKSDKAKKLFERLREVGNINPEFIAYSLIEIDDFGDPSIISYIGLQFYHDFIFMMNGLNRIE